MVFDVMSLVDLIASLGLVLVLSIAYAFQRRLIGFRRCSDAVLGALFGLAAAVQMLRPFEPMEGLIIDLRNIPLAIGGAYLGAHGAITCLAIAVSMRLDIGGVGVWAGILGMSLTLLAARVWRRSTGRADYRGPLAFLGLAFVMSAHLIGAVILPAEARTWFFAEAAMPLLVVNLLAVPLVAWIMEMERRRMQEEARLRRSARFDPDSGLLRLDVFERECAVRADAFDDGSYTQALVVKLRVRHRVDMWLRPVERKQRLAAIRLRLKTLIPDADLATSLEDHTLVVSLTHEALVDRDALIVRAKRAVSEVPFAKGNARHKVHADVAVVDVADLGADLRIAPSETRPNLMSRMFGSAIHERASYIPARLDRFPDTGAQKLDKLFAKADVLIGQHAPKKHRRQRV